MNVHDLLALPAWPTRDRDLRLIACDIAEPLIDRASMDRLVNARAVSVARRYAVGKATAEELRAARDEAAWHASHVSGAFTAIADEDAEHAVLFAALTDETSMGRRSLWLVEAEYEQAHGAKLAAQAEIIERHMTALAA